MLEGEKIGPVLPLSDLFSLFLYGYHKVKEIKESQGKLLCGQEKYVKFHFFSKNVRETCCFPFSHVLWSLKKLYNAKAKCVLIA